MTTFATFPETMGDGRLSNGTSNTICTLADEIKQHATILSNLAAKQGIQPSLAANGCSLNISSTDTVSLQARSELFHAIKQLQGLIKGPLGILMDIGAHEILSLQAITRFRIPQAMREDQEVSFEELSARCGLNINDLQRILRYSMTSFIFCEPKPGIVAHTAVSQMLAQDNAFQDYITNMCEVRFPASVRTVDALEKYGESKEPWQSGFSMSRGTDKGLYDELASNPVEARRWNGAMSGLAEQFDLESVMASIVAVTEKLDRPTIVDVGGGRGDVSLALAKRLPKATFIVQDSSSTAIATGQQDAIPFGNRVQFQLYDFRAPQTVHGADIYYFRNIFHNWPDASCIEILRNQIPALRNGATILIDDFTLHEPGTLAWAEERRRRWMDVTMLVYFGSRERSWTAWQKLIADTDERLHFVSVNSAPNLHNSIMRVEWRGE